MSTIVSRVSHAGAGVRRRRATIRGRPGRAGWMLIVLVLSCLFAAGAWAETGSRKVRLGYFPNVTHAQAVIGVARGDFKRALGTSATLDTVTFNAGPSVIEAVFAGHVDVSYIGPSPTLNGFLQSKGKEIRVIAGAAANGVLIVGNKKRGLTSLDQLRGKRIASPQLGNTQDISARHFVVETLKTQLRERGGDTEIVPMQNPDIEILFAKDQIDAAWVPEPWGSRLIDRGLANLIAEEKDLWPNKQFALTNIIARREFLEKNPDLVRALLQVHVAITKELQADPVGFGDMINAELKRLTGKELAPAVISGSLQHTKFDTDPSEESFRRFFEMGKRVGILKSPDIDLGQLMSTSLLKEVEGGAK